jgi:hypothetical protein
MPMTVGVEKFEPAKSFDHLLIEHHLDGLSTKVRLPPARTLPVDCWAELLAPNQWNLA